MIVTSTNYNIKIHIYISPGLFMILYSAWQIDQFWEFWTLFNKQSCSPAVLHRYGAMWQKYKYSKNDRALTLRI